MTTPALSEEKKDRIESVIEANGGNLNKSSVVLGITASSLRRNMALWNGSRPSREEESPNPTRRFFERTKSPWRVLSFDSKSGEVCIEIKNPSITTNFSFEVPFRRNPE
jgi:hypothetical protein